MSQFDPPKEHEHERSHKNSIRSLSVVVWMVVVLLLLTGLAFHMYKNISTYLNESTSSEINPWTPHSYPDLMFCMSDYINWTRAEELGWSDKEVFVLDAFSPLGSTSFGIMRSESTEVNYRYPGQMLGLIVRDATDLATTVLTRMAALNLTYDQMVEQLSYPAEWRVPISRIYKVAGAEHVTPRSVFTMYGLCTLLPFKEITMTRMQLQYFRAQVGRQRNTNQNGSWEGFYNLFVGDQAGSVVPSAPVMLSPGTNYVLSLQVEHSRRIHTSRNPCLPWTEPERAVCRTQCMIDKACQGDNMCDQEVFGLYRNLTPSSCNIFTKIQRQTDICIQALMLSEDDSCFDECPIMCEEYRYQTTLSTIHERSVQEGYDMVFLLFENPLAARSTVQFLSVPFDELWSNIGGSVSLWCGASVLSIIKLIWELILDRRAKDDVKGFRSKA